MRGNITATFAVGWDAGSRIHRAIKTRQVVIGEAFGYLMNGGSEENARFASTVLDAMGFCRGSVSVSDIKFGNYSARLEEKASREIDHLHKIKAREIYEKHLAKPFMSQQEFNDYLFRQTLSGDQDAFDLLTKEIKKDINIRL